MNLTNICDLWYTIIYYSEDFFLNDEEFCLFVSIKYCATATLLRYSSSLCRALVPTETEYAFPSKITPLIPSHRQSEHILRLVGGRHVTKTVFTILVVA